MMKDAVIRALGAFQAERKGEPAKAMRIHPADYCALLSEIHPGSAIVPSFNPTRYAGMIMLFDNKWPRGFPIALDTEGAATAIEDGARQNS